MQVFHHKQFALYSSYNISEYQPQGFRNIIKALSVFLLNTEYSWKPLSAATYMGSYTTSTKNMSGIDWLA